MARGKYQAQRKVHPLLIIFLVLVAAILIAIGLLYYRLYIGGQRQPVNPEQTQQTTPILTEPDFAQTNADEAPAIPETEFPVPPETKPEETAPAITTPELLITQPEPTEAEPAEAEPTNPPAVDTVKGEEVAAVALSLVGKPERSALHPEGYDVGSLISYCFSQCGVAGVPSDFNILLTYGTEVTQVHNGDVVVFHITPAEGAPYDYMGIVVEGDQFVAVSSSSQMVVKRPLSNFASYPAVYRCFTASSLQQG